MDIDDLDSRYAPYWLVEKLMHIVKAMEKTMCEKPEWEYEFKKNLQELKKNYDQHIGEAHLAHLMKRWDEDSDAYEKKE